MINLILNKFTEISGGKLKRKKNKQVITIQDSLHFFGYILSLYNEGKSQVTYL